MKCVENWVRCGVVRFAACCCWTLVLTGADANADEGRWQQWVGSGSGLPEWGVRYRVHVKRELWAPNAKAARAWRDLCKASVAMSWDSQMFRIDYTPRLSEWEGGKAPLWADLEALSYDGRRFVKVTSGSGGFSWRDLMEEGAVKELRALEGDGSKRVVVQDETPEDDWRRLRKLGQEIIGPMCSMERSDGRARLGRLVECIGGAPVGGGREGEVLQRAVRLGKIAVNESPGGEVEVRIDTTFGGVVWHESFLFDPKRGGALSKRRFEERKGSDGDVLQTVEWEVSKWSDAAAGTGIVFPEVAVRNWKRKGDPDVTRDIFRFDGWEVIKDIGDELDLAIPPGFEVRDERFGVVFKTGKALENAIQDIREMVHRVSREK